MGSEEARRKRQSSGRQCFEKCIALQPTHHRCRYALACLLAKNGERRAAMEHLRKAMSVDFENREYRAKMKELQAMDGGDGDGEEKVNVDEKEDEEKQSVNALVKRSLLLKERKENVLVCLDDEFKEVSLGMEQLKLKQRKEIAKVAEQGAVNKKDVRIVVLETQDKAGKILTQKISHAD